MEKFVKKIIVAVAGALLVFLSIKAITFRNYKNYNSAFVDKLKMLKESRQTKKIVLIGGSAVGWGLSAELIEKRTGIRTINLGHHAGFGLTDFQKFISDNLNKEDVVIFSPEWMFYSNPGFFDKATLNNLRWHNYDYGELLQNRLYAFGCLFSEIKFAPADDPLSPYRYHCLDANGDVITQCGLQGAGPLLYPVKEESRIDEFPNYFPFMRTNKVIFAFPPTQARIYAIHKAYFDKISASLIEHHYSVAGTVAENVYPESDFFDAEYHLICQVRQERTEKLIGYLFKSGVIDSLRNAK